MGTEAGQRAQQAWVPSSGDAGRVVCLSAYWSTTPWGTAAGDPQRALDRARWLQRVGVFSGGLEPAALHGLAVWAFGPLAVGILLGLAMALLLDFLVRKGRLPGRKPSPWRRHRYTILLPAAGGMLWMIGSFDWATRNTLFLLNLFFLPAMVFLYRLVPEWVGYVIVLVMVPGGYLLAGLLMDVIRVGGNPRARAWGCSSAAVFLLASVASFLIFGDAHDPYFPYPGPLSLRAIIAAYGALIAALAWFALKAWRQLSPRRAAVAKSSDE